MTPSRTREDLPGDLDGLVGAGQDQVLKHDSHKGWRRRRSGQKELRRLGVDEEQLSPVAGSTLMSRLANPRYPAWRSRRSWPGRGGLGVMATGL